MERAIYPPRYTINQMPNLTSNPKKISLDQNKHHSRSLNIKYPRVMSLGIFLETSEEDLPSDKTNKINERDLGKVLQGATWSFFTV